MNGLKRFADMFLDRIAAPCWLLVAVCIIGLGSEVVGISQQTPVQRGIDAHTVRLTATLTELIEGSLLSDDKYILSYVYNGREVSTPLRGLPGYPDIGAQLCVEIDATRPENGRVCGTRGGLGDAQSGLIWGGSFLTLALATLWARSRWRLRRTKS
jgi:hypothetical protein